MLTRSTYKSDSDDICIVDPPTTYLEYSREVVLAALIGFENFALLDLLPEEVGREKDAADAGEQLLQLGPSIPLLVLDPGEDGVVHFALAVHVQLVAFDQLKPSIV